MTFGTKTRLGGDTLWQPLSSQQWYQYLFYLGFQLPSWSFNISELVNSFLDMLWSNPPNKNVEKWNGQLKFEVTDLEYHLHKVTDQF